MDRIKQMLDTITELTDEQVAELQSAIVSEFETVEGRGGALEFAVERADFLDRLVAAVERGDQGHEGLELQAAAVRQVE